MKTKLMVFLLLGILVLAGAWIWLHSSQSNPETNPVVQATPDQTQPTATTTQPTPPQAASVATVAPAAAAQADELAPSVRLIVDENQPYMERLAACRALSQSNLDQGNLQALYEFLRQKSQADEDQNGQALKNELMDSLTSMKPPPARLGEALVQIYRDKNGEEVIRDYAIQHLSAHYEQLEGSKGSGAGDTQEAQVRTALWEALRETDTSIAGTALLGLNHLASGGRAEFDRDKIGTAALQLAKSSDACDLVHISAFQICASLGLKEALPLLIQTARESENMPLRISAIGALGILGEGNSEARTLLQELQQGDDGRLQRPAQLALKRITQVEQRAAQVQ